MVSNPISVSVSGEPHLVCGLSNMLETVGKEKEISLALSVNVLRGKPELGLIVPSTISLGNESTDSVVLGRVSITEGFTGAGRLKLLSPKTNSSGTYSIGEGSGLTELFTCSIDEFPPNSKSPRFFSCIGAGEIFGSFLIGRFGEVTIGEKGLIADCSPLNLLDEGGEGNGENPNAGGKIACSSVNLGD
jgi:hypothetical protein